MFSIIGLGERNIRTTKGACGIPRGFVFNSAVDFVTSEEVDAILSTGVIKVERGQGAFGAYHDMRGWHVTSEVQLSATTRLSAINLF